MNEGLVHNPLLNLPSYDAGVSLEFEKGNLRLSLVGMRSKNEMDKYYTWVGGQLTYHWENPLGEGNYRLCLFTTDKNCDGDMLLWDWFFPQATWRPYLFLGNGPLLGRSRRKVPRSLS